jgi:hypothetical protein
MTGATLVPIEQVDSTVDVVAKRVAEAEAQADALQVTNAGEAEAAAEVLRDIARYKKGAEAERTELVKPLNDHVKLINKKFKDAIAPFEAADKKIRAKVETFTAEQERRRREEEQRLERERQERERKAREERERQEAEAKAKREQAEADARAAEELADEGEDPGDLAEEAAQKLAEAQTAESAISSLPEPTLPRQVVEKPAAPTGTSTRMVWKHRLVDPAAVPREYLVVDEKKIRQAVRDGVREIPGVVIEQKPELAVRT